MIRTLLVDDETAANQRMQELLGEYPEIHLLGSVRSVAEAAQFIQHNPPDLIFLDMEMPGSNGLNLIPLLNGKASVVFVTGHEKYAVQAFAVGAVDYLLKPVSQERLSLTMARLIPSPPSSQLRGDLTPKAILEASKNQQEIIPHQEIVWIEALQNYTRILLRDDRRVIVRKTITEWSEELPAEQFIRLDRFLLIQISLLTSTRRESRDRTLLFFKGIKDGIPIGRLGAIRLRELNWPPAIES